MLDFKLVPLGIGGGLFLESEICRCDIEMTPMCSACAAEYDNIYIYLEQCLIG